jgi:hypothetical protein
MKVISKSSTLLPFGERLERLEILNLMSVYGMMVNFNGPRIYTRLALNLLHDQSLSSEYTSLESELDSESD